MSFRGSFIKNNSLIQSVLTEFLIRGAVGGRYHSNIQHDYLNAYFGSWEYEKNAFQTP